MWWKNITSRVKKVLLVEILDQGKFVQNGIKIVIKFEGILVYCLGVEINRVILQVKNAIEGEVKFSG